MNTKVNGVVKKRSAVCGKNLDEALERLLAEMISIGIEKAPISRGAVQHRLGLRSRATLVGKRGSMIDEARAAQLRDSGVEPSAKRRRASLEERIQRLEAENRQLIAEKNRLYEALSTVVLACQAQGIYAEDVLLELKPR